MAILNRRALAKINRNAFKNVMVNYDDTQLNPAVQAIEDWFEGQRLPLSSAINAATSPITLTNPEKKRLVAYFLADKLKKELA